MEIKNVVIALILIAGSAGTATVQVDIVNFAFQPETLSVSFADTVLWINQTAIVHTTTSGINGVPDGLWNSGNLSSGDSFSFVFDTTGVFPYFCIPHWAMGMTGVVVVEPTGIEEKETNFESTRLYVQNTPNPFTDRTQIRFNLSHSGVQNPVSLQIFDITGKTIMEYDINTAGGSIIEWDGLDDRGRDVPKGVYFYEFKAGGVLLREKMIKTR